MNKKEEVINILKEIIDPELGKDIVSLDFVKDIEIEDDGKVYMRLLLTSPLCPLKDYFKNEIRKRLKENLKWFKDVEIAFDVKEEFFLKRKPEGIKRIILILSGKGGVGKSTISINIAFSLKERGKKVALLDADFYGPTISTLKGKVYSKEGKILPFEKEGVKILSIGYLIDRDSPIIWRGPLIHSTLRQLLFDTEWGDVDYLIIDLPPGTGDPIISLSQLTSCDGGIAISTPQEISLNDVRRAINMLFKVNIPLIGIVENMSYFVCENCGKKHYIFGNSYIKEFAKEKNIEILGEIPFNRELTSLTDKGEIFVLKKKESELTKVFFEIAEKILKRYENL